MTSANPPYPYFDGITYNSQYFVSSGSGLTQTQANALYLRKTTADTAAALETFTGGILTNDIQPTTTSEELTIGNSQTDGTLRLGNGGATRTGNIVIGSLTMTGEINIETRNTNNSITSPAINIGTAAVNKWIKIGNSSNTGTVSLGNFQVGTNSTTNAVSLNCINATSNTINLGSTQAAGVLNLGTGTARTSAGNVNIATTNSNQCAVNVMNGNTTGGSVNIATGTGATQTTAVNIGSGSTTGAVAIGNKDNTTNILSGTTNINTGTGTLAIPLEGTVNIATGTGSTFVSTAVNIGTGNTSGTMTIGNSTNTTTINSATINYNGTLTMGSGKNITLQPTAGYVQPTALTMLGGITAGSFTTSASAFSSEKNIATITLEKGTYLIFYTFQANYTTLPTRNILNFNVASTASPLPTFTNGPTQIVAGSLSFMGSLPVSITTGGTVILIYTITGTINTITSALYQAVRIA